MGTILKLTVGAGIAGGIAFGSYKIAERYSADPAVLAGVSTGVSVIIVGLIAVAL